MSHFTSLSKVDVVDKQAFIKAAKELGFTEVILNGKMNGYQGNKMDADVVVRKKGCPYDIGLVKKGKKFDVISDWWGVRQHSVPDIESRISQLTTKHTVVNKYAKLGFLAKTTTDKQGNLVVSLSR